MATKESKTSKSASHLQTKSSNVFFDKKNGEVFGSEKNTTQSAIQTKASSAPFFGNSNIQAKLEIHPSDDIYEKEADSMADRIMQHEHAAPLANPDDGNGNDGIETTPLHNSISRLQRQRAFESPTILETNSANQTGADELFLQKKSNDNTASEASSDMVTMLNSSSGQGASLPKDTREKMESGFGSDFTNVNVHTGKDAEQMNDQIGARAFTHGNDIYFNKGEYKPGTSSGDHLIAHELTHTVQQGGSIKKKAIQKAGIKDITAERLSAITPGKSGKIVRNGDVFEFTLTNMIIKGYGGVDFAKQAGAIIPKPESGTRKTQQAPIWKTGVRTLISGYLGAMIDPSIKNDLLTLGLKKNKGTKLVGTFEEILERCLVPLWNKDGNPVIYEVEHKIDWQVLGEHADKLPNLMLLNRATNNLYGKTIKAKIQQHVTDVLTHYKSKGIKELPNTAAEAADHIKIFYETSSFIPDTVAPGDIVFKESLEAANNPGNPFNKNHLDFGKASIPDDHMIIKTRADGIGYILPFNSNKVRIGGFFVTTKGDAKAGKLTYVRLDPALSDKKSIIKKKNEPLDAQYSELGDNTKVFLIESKSLSAKIKQLVTITGMSPVDFSDVTIDGLDVKAKGKVLSDLSFLQGVDINITLDNGNFSIQAVLPLDQLQSKIPKPFVITGSNIAVEASSETGLSVSGLLKFKIGSFGEGEVSASLSSSTGFNLAGQFSFNSKWFKPAEINFDYKNGKWAIGGTIGIEDGMVKGIKKATLMVKYQNETFSADGDAKLEVPGIDSVKLSAMFNEATGFKFTATADLKKLPGIKSGSVTVSILSKGEEIKLGVGGTAEPDFPGVPGLTSSLTVMYEDGVFDMRAKVGYKKGRFDGTVEVGVTNKTVDDKGLPQGEPQKGNNVVVFGFGSLTVDLFKGSKGTISVRLTPDKQLLVAGSFTVQNVKPFGDGVNIKKGKEFPSVKIPLVGIPGVSIFFEIGGGAYFTFNWDPLVLKELTISFTETNINEIETAQVNIHGEIGSKAVAEAYMELKASLGAEVLIAEIKGSLAGQAGIRVEAEAGGSVDATWNNEKGLQLKQVNASLSVDPKAFFRLKGSISVDLDLWITTINLYYKEWTLAEGEAQLGGLALKVNFPIKFDEEGNLIRPEFEQLNVEKPDFSGDQGKAALDSGINADAKKERKLAQDKLRQDIAHDIRESYNKEEFSPSEYAKKLQKKYKDDAEMKAFIMDSVEEEVRIREYEEFDQLKNELKKSDLSLNQKIGKAMVFKMFRARISPSDYDAFISELRAIEQQKQEAAAMQQQQPQAAAPATT